MQTKDRLKKLAWIMAVELALMPSAFAQDPVAAEPAPESTAVGEPAPATVEAAPAEAASTETAAAAPSDAPAAAPETAAPADDGGGAPQSSGSRVFEEIIVTAQKREENLADVPIAVQAFSAAALDARGINSTQDLMKATPSLDFGVQAGDFASVFLRGIGSEAWLTSDPSVASYTDGVYYSFTPSLIQDLGGIERVEVLKGPQGTLFGRNAIAGAINVITKEPDFEDRSVTIDNFTGSYSGRHGQDSAVGITKTTIFANVPLTDTFAMNVSSFFEYDRQQWGKGSTIGGDFGSSPEPIPAKKIYSARVKARWMPNDTFELRSTVWATKRDGTATLAANIRPTPFGNLVQGVTGTDEQHRIVNPGLPIYGHLQSTVGILQPIIYGDWFDTKLITSVQVHSNPYNYDYDGAGGDPGDERGDFASFLVKRHYAQIQEAELNLTSNDTSWGADWLTWSAGGFYFRNTQGFDPVEVTVGGLNAAELAGVGLPTDLADALSQVTLPDGTTLGTGGGLTPAYALSNIGTLRTESWSGYFQTTAKLTDWFALTLGGRHQNERRGVLESKTDIRYGTSAITPPVFDWKNIGARDSRDNPVTGGTLPFTRTISGFSPKVTLDFKPFLAWGDEDTLLYATWQRATKAHSYNAFAFYYRPAYVPPETIKAYEVGLKGSLFDGAMRYSTAAFFYQLTNLQTQFISLLNGGALSLDVAGNAESKGIDFDITTFILPSTFDSLVMTLNGAYIDSTYTKYENGDGQDPTTGIFGDNVRNYTGNRTTRTPKYSGSVALTNTWQIPGGPLEASANAYYNSGFFYVASEDPRYEQEAYIIGGAKVSYLWEKNRFRTTLSVENIGDVFYTGGTLILDPGMLASLGLQRMVGLKFQYTF